MGVNSLASEQRPKVTRYGDTAPRVYTPPLRPLTSETTAGYAVIEFTEQVLCISLYLWQKWLLIHALELLPNGDFRFRTVVILVARQNGKSTIGQVLALWFLYILRVALVLGTAQNLDVASDLWRDTVDMARSVDDLDAEIVNVSRQVSRETLELTNRRRYQVAAATRRGSRGKSGDLVLLDELREHQSWHAWSAITKTTMARRKALVWCMSNAGDDTSLPLRHLRRQAHGRAGDPDGLAKNEEITIQEGDGSDPDIVELMEQQADSLGIFEWSAVPGCSIWDIDGWAAANPAMNYGELSQRNIASAASTDPEREFRTEVLCQWVDTLQPGPFNGTSWEDGQVLEQPPPGTDFMLGLDVSRDRTSTSIVAGYLRPDGAPQVNLEAHRTGTAWVADWFAQHATEDRPLTVGLQARGAPCSSLADDLAAVPYVTVVPWGGPHLGNATARLFDLVQVSGETMGVRQGLCHLPAPALDLAAARAIPRILSDGGMAWDRNRSSVDIAPLVAATVALWLIMAPPEKKRVSAYESGTGLMIMD